MVLEQEVSMHLFRLHFTECYDYSWYCNTYTVVSIGPVGGKVPIIMGTSSGFIGVFSSITKVMGGGVLAYGAIMGASIIGGLLKLCLVYLLSL